MLLQYPYDQKLKRSLTAIQYSDNVVRVFIKGSPEYVLPNCTTMLSPAGQTEWLTEDNNNNLQCYIKQSICKQGLKAIAFSYVDFNMVQWANTIKSIESIEQQSMFVGLVCIEETLLSVD